MTVGVIGGGQLGRMLALAGLPLGLDFCFLDPNPEAVKGLGHCILADYADPEALVELARRSQCITFEFENVPTAALAGLSCPVWPPLEALETSQDRVLEKQLLEQLGIPVAPYRAVDTQLQLEAALAELGCPAILKTRRLGYDGKGQHSVDSPEALPVVASGMVLEQRIPFDRELSIAGVRSAQGQLLCYPVSQNVHHQGVLHSSRWVQLAPELEGQAVGYLQALAERLEYVGVLCLEMFEWRGRLWANEFAPRVHNSGHWTIDGALTSQFQNHLRAGLGLPLGETRALGPAGMVNCLGSLPPCAEVLAISGASFHHYCKQLRPGRKVGHLGLLSRTDTELRSDLRRLERLTEELT